MQYLAHLYNVLSSGRRDVEARDLVVREAASGTSRLGEADIDMCVCICMYVYMYIYIYICYYYY